MNTFQLFFIFIRLPLDYLALMLAAFSAYLIRLSDPIVSLRHVNIGLDFDQYIRAAFLVAIIWIIIFALSGLYNTNPNWKFVSEIRTIVFACSVGFAAVAVLVFLRGELFNSRFIVLAASAIAVLFVCVERMMIRLAVHFLHKQGMGNTRVVIIGDDESSQLIARMYEHYPYAGSVVVKKFTSFNEKVARIIKEESSHKRIDEIILTHTEDKEQTLALISFCEQHHMTFKYTADLFSTYAPARHLSVVFGIPLVELRRTRLHGWGRIIKRLFDVTSASILIVVLSPVFVAVCMLIAWETGLPIIFKNKRVGEKGELFNVLKFRTMYQADSIGEQFAHSQQALKKERKLIQKNNIKQGPVYKVADDPRVTPVGRVLREWSLDELPQLFNVLNGSMSMVGPRPHQPREVENYDPHHRKVLAIKPGITGIAQVSGRSNLNFEDEVRLDTLYIEQWSLLSDMVIVLKTPYAIIRKDGAY